MKSPNREAGSEQFASRLRRGWLSRRAWEGNYLPVSVVPGGMMLMPGVPRWRGGEKPD